MQKYSYNNRLGASYKKVKCMSCGATFIDDNTECLEYCPACHSDMITGKPFGHGLPVFELIEGGE